MIDLQVYKARKQSRGETTRIRKSREKEEEREGKPTIGEKPSRHMTAAGPSKHLERANSLKKKTKGPGEKGSLSTSAASQCANRHVFSATTNGSLGQVQSVLRYVPQPTCSAACWLHLSWGILIRVS